MLDLLHKPIFRNGFFKTVILTHQMYLPIPIFIF